MVCLKHDKTQALTSHADYEKSSHKSHDRMHDANPRKDYSYSVKIPQFLHPFNKFPWNDTSIQNLK